MDSRILKEMGALHARGYSVAGLGVKMEEGTKPDNIDFDTEIDSIFLQSRKLLFLPQTLRHIITLFELFAKMLPRAINLKPDIIHCHDTLALPIGAIAKLFTGSKLVYDAHELESNRNGLSALQGWLTRVVEKLFWPSVDALIVVSPSIEAWYSSNIGPKLSTVILNSPVYDSNESSGGDYLRIKFEIDENVNIFIYVGILGAGRGIELIVDVFKRSEIKSHVVFLGYGSLRDELKALSAIYPNIHLHDAVPHSQVVPIVRSASYGLCLIQNVSLSDYFCLPNKLFEYCFAGVPVLASDFPDIRLVVDQYNIGVYCGLDSDSILKLIKNLEVQPRNLKFNDLQPLSWQAQEKKLIELYECFN